ncbi:MAG: hypothetical protein V1773_00655 [bacterium]
MEKARKKAILEENEKQYYPNAFKRKIVQEVLEGKFTKAEAQRLYGIGGKSAILTWMRKFNLVTNYSSPSKPNIAESPMPEIESDISKDQRIRELKKALEIEKNKSMLFEKIIEIAEDQYGIPIRKKSEAKQYSSLNQKKGKK